VAGKPKIDPMIPMEVDGNGHFQLPEEVKRRIVTEFACFRRSGEILKILEDEYGVTHIEQRNLFRYDASKGYSVCSPELRKLFDETRKNFIEGRADIHLQSQGFRLRTIQRLIEKAEALGTLAGFELAGRLIEQAAKDFGGVFTNVRQVQGDFTHTNMTVEDARERIKALQAREASKRAETGETIQ
jgi:hypothetical protein